MTFRFEVPGKPIPQGSTRAFVNPKTGKAITTNKTPALVHYRADVRYYAEECGLPPIEGPCAVTVVFWFPRPKSHLNSKGAVKPSAPDYPATRPDADKLVRACLDGLTGVCFADDAQVVDIKAAKRYGASGETAIEVRAA